MNMWIVITVGGILLFTVAVIYARARNKGADSPGDIARTEAATKRARDETDRETTD